MFVYISTYIIELKVCPYVYIYIYQVDPAATPRFPPGKSVSMGWFGSLETVVVACIFSASVTRSHPPAFFSETPFLSLPVFFLHPAFLAPVTRSHPPASSLNPPFLFSSRNPVSPAGFLSSTRRSSKQNNRKAAILKVDQMSSLTLFHPTQLVTHVHFPFSVPPALNSNRL